ncbi:MAG TPA: 2-amino-4-hydroxy-6-hydroxymethyldihydropteridine diphosphokinase [Candidatus Saccharimonadales bacterium]|nr:2-amino-4-hydroxy-6-hydroxymethyldihydropteridine diphosphokinase [Candidatus Saccharimonadales bacterium]
MITVYLALGSNVGDSARYIAKAVELLAAQVHDIEQAPLYVSHAVGYTDQPDFVNTALRGQTNLSPQELLTFVKDIEQHVGRIFRFRWGPREIDIDIILYGDKVVAKENLTIPHARFRERDFVLKPLCDLDPNVKDPITRKTAAELLQAIPAAEQSLAGDYQADQA